jgi:hypothetical protein
MSEEEPNEEYISPPRTETAEELLGWQIETYQHLVQLSQSVLTTFLTMTTVIVTALTLGRQYIPSLDVSGEVSQLATEPLHTIKIRHFTFHLSFTTNEVNLIVAANIFIFIAALFVAGVAAITGIRALFEMVFWDRLPIQSKQPELGMKREFSGWSTSNSQIISQLREQLHVGGRYGYLAIVFLAIGGTAYLAVAGVEVLTLLGMNTVLVFGTAVFYLKRKSNQEQKQLVPKIPDETLFFNVARITITTNIIIIAYLSSALLLTLLVSG